MEIFLDPETVRDILGVIDSYGYAFILLGAMLQGIGLPLPAQTILVTAGVMAGQGVLNPYYAFLFGLLGALAGSQAGYFAGRRGGRPLVLKAGRFVGITAPRLDRAEEVFERRGPKVILVARFVPVVKTFGYITAGLVKMPYLLFLRNDAAGTAIWTAVSIVAGIAVSASVISVIT